jgi:cyclophilin family peptidyl-prolyl cis-trans isomerase/HEAT repeat protein
MTTPILRREPQAIERTALPALLVAVLAGLLGACAPATPGVGPTPDAGSALDARLLQMVDLRRGDTTVVDAVLADVSGARRARAALAIGQVKLRARYPELRRLLTDSDTAVAANAAYALGVAHDTASVTALARAVAGAPESVAREAAWALGEIGEPARAVLTVALGDGEAQPLNRSTAAQREPSVRAALLRSTVKLRVVPIGALRPWLADTASETVRAAAYVIGRQRLPGGVRALLAVRAHRDEETRQHVARGLARSAAGDSLAAASREALVALLADASPRVRANAARSLGSYGPSAMRDIERALADVDANVRVAASELAQSVFARDTAAWRRAWMRDTTFRVRQQLMQAARAAEVSTLASGETEWSTHPDWRRRLAALEVRASANRSDRWALASAFARDPDSRVRASALALIPPTASDSAARSLVEGAHVDASMALQVLVPRARAADLELALSAHERARRDAEADARLAALRLVAAAWGRDSARVDDAMRARLRAFNAPSSPEERRAVMSVSPMAAWATTVTASVPRPLAEYERVARRWLTAGARQPRAVIRTDHGDITIELFGAEAPLVVEAFLQLAYSGFYRNTTFHRVVPNFVAQDGDPRGDGSGGPGFALRDSPSRRRHERGSLGLATSGPDTGGSQYYLCHSSQPHLDGAYTVFGRVVDGFDVLDRIVQGDRMLRIDIR